ncbi:uncharacterized protein LOC117325744 [Pecten maximus]|uniref:uncharacterized protein LOC117325744 n=1 Tax=Pecten maximus TaxID=6579 RepID=UPI0014580A4C|nr:uncharacterized protein LOC117325744 [Pecten maximus]
MASKQKYSVTRMQKLPPIREESFAVPTPRTPRVPYSNASVPVKAGPSVPPSNEPKANLAALNTTSLSKPRIHVRPLPGTDPNDDADQPKMVQKPRLTVEMPMTPNDSHTLVDGLVADYLHYAAYGHIIPVYEGIGQLQCSCCNDRNRENVRNLLGLPSSDKKVIKHKKAQLGRLQPKFVPPTKPKENHEVDEKAWNAPKKNHNQKIDWKNESWMKHQPLPAATNFLNPEFNRPVYAYQKPPEIEIPALVSDSVLHANTKYDQSMRRLEKMFRIDPDPPPNPDDDYLYNGPPEWSVM